MMKKNKIMMIMMTMIVPGMTTLPTILVVVLAIAAVRNGRLVIDLTAPTKSIDEVAQGNIKVYMMLCPFIDYFYVIMNIFTH